MEYNPGASFAWLQRNDDNRKMYKIQTKNSKECKIYFKYAFEKTNGSQSWLYRFSDNKKEDLKKYYREKIPTFVYLLCGVKELKIAK